VGLVCVNKEGCAVVMSRVYEVRANAYSGCVVVILVYVVLVLAECGSGVRYRYTVMLCCSLASMKCGIL